MDTSSRSSGEMWERQDRKLDEEALRVIDPYIFVPCGGEPMWLRWTSLPRTDAAGFFRERDGLPVMMTMEECAHANSEIGILPDCWDDDSPCAWLNGVQKRAFYEAYPERFNRKAGGGLLR